MSQMRLLVIHKVVVRDLNSKWDSNLQFNFIILLFFSWLHCPQVANKLSHRFLLLFVLAEE